MEVRWLKMAQFNEFPFGTSGDFAMKKMEGPFNGMCYSLLSKFPHERRMAYLYERSTIQDLRAPSLIQCWMAVELKCCMFALEQIMRHFGCVLNKQTFAELVTGERCHQIQNVSADVERPIRNLLRLPRFFLPTYEKHRVLLKNHCIRQRGGGGRGPGCGTAAGWNVRINNPGVGLATYNICTQRRMRPPLIPPPYEGPNTNPQPCPFSPQGSQHTPAPQMRTPLIPPPYAGPNPNPQPCPFSPQRLPRSPQGNNVLDADLVCTIQTLCDTACGIIQQIRNIGICSCPRSPQMAPPQTYENLCNAITALFNQIRATVTNPPCSPQAGIQDVSQPSLYASTPSSGASPAFGGSNVSAISAPSLYASPASGGSYISAISPPNLYASGASGGSHISAISPPILYASGASGGSHISAISTPNLYASGASGGSHISAISPPTLYQSGASGGSHISAISPPNLYASGASGGSHISAISPPTLYASGASGGSHISAISPPNLYASGASGGSHISAISTPNLYTSNSSGGSPVVDGSFSIHSASPGADHLAQMAVMAAAAAGEAGGPGPHVVEVVNQQEPDGPPMAFLVTEHNDSCCG